MINKTNKLNRIFNPRTIAIIGAKPEENSVGWGLLKNALEGKSLRRVFPINPFHEEILGEKCLPSVKSITEEVDLVVIAVPAKIIPKVVMECCEKKVGGMIIISSGFGESGEAGKKLEEQVRNMAQNSGIPLIGPNCLGIIRPDILLNASFAPAMPKTGGIAFISQSGALVDSVIDENLKQNYGFSTLISYGNESDVTLADFLKWAADDEKTKVITLYMEGVKNGREIMDVFSEVAQKKPILVLKAGRTKEGKNAISSHTGALAGDYQVYQTLFKQTGVIEVDSVRELFNSAKALAWQPKCQNGIAIVTNGGSCGVLLADYCENLGVKLTSLSAQTLKKLNEPGVMHPAYSKRNPLDVVGDALADRYESAIKILLAQPNIYGLIVVQTLQIMTETEKNAKIIIEAQKKWTKKPILTAFLGGKITEVGVNMLEKNHIPSYRDLKDVAIAIKFLTKK